MRKAAHILFITGAILVILYFVLRMLQYREMSRTILFISLLPLVAGRILYIYSKKRIVEVPQYYGRAKGFNTLIISGAIVTIAGLAFKIMHVHNSEYMVAGGLFVTMFAFVYLLSVVIRGREYASSEPEVFLSDTELASYAGTYSSNMSDELLEFSVVNHQLTVKAGSQASFPLTVVKEHVFSNIKWSTVIIFDPDKGNLALIRNGRSLQFAKK